MTADGAGPAGDQVGQAGDQVGSAADEAVRLLGAAEEWVRSHAGTLLDEEHLANGSASCAVCPVCQAVAALRQVRPETVAHLLSAGAAFAAALRSAVTAAPGPAAAGGHVQHIDLDEA
ncbi:MAG: hypothetical protein JWL64_2119 [Frankiales bacterium]|nr:hypothetical protein [Frankiales bacterium]